MRLTTLVNVTHTQSDARRFAFRVGVAFATIFCGLLLNGTSYAQMRFENVTDSKLVGAIDSESWGLSVGDLEGDYWPDIFVTNHRNRSSLFQYNRDGKFVNNILQRDTGRSWLGVRYDDTHGAAWNDFDNDGDDDLVVGTNAAAYHFLMLSENSVFQNESEQRLGEDTSSSYSLWFDLDRDGRSDLFQGRDSGDLSVYFRQQATAGIFDPSVQQPGCEGDWAFLTDVTGDNTSDLICAREGGFPTAAFNIKNGIFENIASSVPRLSHIIDGIAADLNNDLRSDMIFVRGALSQSHATQHNARLIEIAADTGSDELVRFTFNGGGNLTLNSWSPPVVRDNKTVSGSTTIGGFNLNFDAASNRWTVERTSSGWEYAYLQVRSSQNMSNLRIERVSVRDLAAAPEIFHQQSGGGWINRTTASGMRTPMDCRSLVAADFDNDMDQDLFMACGQGTRNTPNRLFMNNGSGVFTEVNNAAGAAGVTGAPFADSAGTGESVATGDFNNDGFIDLFVLNGNNSQPVRGRFGPSELFLNDAPASGNSNHWIALNLIGTTSASSASGARVIATAGGINQLREVGANYHRWTQNDDRVHFGLGSNQRVDLQVMWPSGQVENFNRVAADSIYEIVEGSGITAINPAPPADFPAPVSGDECGTPEFFPDMDSGIFIYKNCNSNRWSIRATAANNIYFGDKRYRYNAELTSDGAISVVDRVSIESNDSVDTSNFGIVNIEFNVQNGATDGFDFVLNDPNTCFSLTSPMPDDLRIMLGRNHLPVTLPMNLNTMGQCQTTQTPELSVSDASVREDAGSADFVIRLSPANPSQTVTVSTAGTRIDSTPGSDYYGFSGVVTFAPNETTKNVNVTILNDTEVESDERLGIRLYRPANAVIAKGTAEMVIVDDDNPTTPTPEVSIADVVVDESETNAAFTLSLSPANNNEVVTVVVAATQTGTATHGVDYYGFYNTVTFQPGETRKDMTLRVLDDDVSGEGNETLGARLVNVEGAVFGDRTATMTIVDND